MSQTPIAQRRGLVHNISVTRTIPKESRGTINSNVVIFTTKCLSACTMITFLQYELCIV